MNMKEYFELGARVIVLLAGILKVMHRSKNILN